MEIIVQKSIFISQLALSLCIISVLVLAGCTVPQIEVGMPKALQTIPATTTNAPSPTAISPGPNDINALSPTGIPRAKSASPENIVAQFKARSATEHLTEEQWVDAFGAQLDFGNWDVWRIHFVYANERETPHLVALFYSKLDDPPNIHLQYFLPQTMSIIDMGYGGFTKTSWGLFPDFASITNAFEKTESLRSGKTAIVAGCDISINLKMPRFKGPLL